MERDDMRRGDPRQRGRGATPHRKAKEPLVEVVAIAVITAALGLAGEVLLSSERMCLVWPALACVAIFVAFVRILSLRTRGNLCGELGFVYLAIAMAYTILPAVKLIVMNFNVPLSFDGLLFAASFPTAEELGTHFWRQVLFLSGVSVGFLVVRTMPLSQKATPAAPRLASGFTIAVFSLVVACSIGVDVYLSRSPTQYVEYYTRFEDLSWSVTRLVGLTGILKSGGYFIVLVLMFSRYRTYRFAIYVFAALICTYETWHSLGSRIEAYTILLAMFGLYHYQVRPIGVKKGAALLVVLALTFSAVGLIRAADYSVERALYETLEQKTIQGSEFDAVIATSFHIYQERNQGTLPPRDWRMFFWEFIAVVPFVDHTTYHPQYWYTLNYFPRAVVPPTSLGVVAESGLWGGELELLVRSLLNGALFAGLTRWFLRRRQKWWVLTVYIYCYATCVLTLKYSVLYQMIPLVRFVLPTLLLAGGLLRLQARFPRFTKVVSVGAAGVRVATADARAQVPADARNL
jgi:hypothetical protein